MCSPISIPSGIFSVSLISIPSGTFSVSLIIIITTYYNYCHTICDFCGILMNNDVTACIMHLGFLNFANIKMQGVNYRLDKCLWIGENLQ